MKEASIGDLLKEFLLSDSEEIRESEIEIGTVSEELREKYISWSKKKTEFKDNVEVWILAQKLKAQREYQEKFEYEENEIDEEKKVLWEDIKKELEIFDEGKFLHLEPRTGKVSKYIKLQGFGHDLQ